MGKNVKTAKKLDLSNAKEIWDWMYNLRAVLLSIPVIIAAIVMAIVNISRLPDQVGLDMLAVGDFQVLVAKGIAVMAPLALTTVCLLLVFCSKKVLFPWLISVFSLALPVVLWHRPVRI